MIGSYELLDWDDCTFDTLMMTLYYFDMMIYRYTCMSMVLFEIPESLSFIIIRNLFSLHMNKMIIVY